MTKLETLLRFQRNNPELFDQILSEYYQDQPEWLEFQSKVVEPTKNMGDITGRQLLFIVSMRVLEMKDARKRTGNLRNIENGSLSRGQIKTPGGS